MVLLSAFSYCASSWYIICCNNFRLGQIDNELIVNPTRRDLEKSSLNLIVAATTGNLVVMMEGHADIILQQDLLKAIKLGMVSYIDLYLFVYL